LLNALTFCFSYLVNLFMVRSRSFYHFKTSFPSSFLRDFTIIVLIIILDTSTRKKFHDFRIIFRNLETIIKALTGEMSHFVRHDGSDCYNEPIFLWAPFVQSQEENISTFIFNPVHICRNFAKSSIIRNLYPGEKCLPCSLFYLFINFLE
jgi:hypothetical protein